MRACRPTEARSARCVGSPIAAARSPAPPSYDAFGAVRFQSGASLSLGYTGQLTDPGARLHRSPGTAAGPDPGSLPLGRHPAAQRARLPGLRPVPRMSPTNPNHLGEIEWELDGRPDCTLRVGTAMVGIFAILLTSVVAGACLATAGWCLTFLMLGLGLSSTTGLLVATAVIVIAFALIACALDAACRDVDTRHWGDGGEVWLGCGGWSLEWRARGTPATRLGRLPVIQAVHAVINEYRFLSQRSGSRAENSKWMRQGISRQRVHARALVFQQASCRRAASGVTFQSGRREILRLAVRTQEAGTKMKTVISGFGLGTRTAAHTGMFSTRRARSMRMCAPNGSVIGDDNFPNRRR